MSSMYVCSLILCSACSRLRYDCVGCISFDDTPDLDPLSVSDILFPLMDEEDVCELCGEKCPAWVELCVEVSNSCNKDVAEDCDDDA